MMGVTRIIKQRLLKVTLEDNGTPGSMKRGLGWAAYRLYPVLYPGEFKESEKKVEKMKWLLLFGLTEAWAVDWKYYGQTQTASYFFDVESIIDQEKIVRVWVKAVYSEEGRLEEKRKLGGKYSNLTDSRALVEIDCKNKWHDVAVLIVYSMEGEVIISDFRELERDFRVPESILEAFCKTLRQ
jgi:hypothetical protein